MTISVSPETSINIKPANTDARKAKYPKGFSSDGKFYSEAGYFYKHVNYSWKCIELYMPDGTGIYQEPYEVTMQRFLKDCVDAKRGTRYSIERRGQVLTFLYQDTDSPLLVHKHLCSDQSPVTETARV